MPTKSDQMKKMREFEDKIIKKKDAEERKLSPGGKEIARIERRLKKVRLEEFSKFEFVLIYHNQRCVIESNLSRFI